MEDKKIELNLNESNDSQQTSNATRSKFHFKSVFTRLLVMYLGILILSFVILAAGVSQPLKSYFIKEKEVTMINQAKRISREFALAYFTNGMTKNRFEEQMGTLVGYINARICLIESDGITYADRSIKDEDIRKIIESDQLNQIFYGETQTIPVKFSKPSIVVGCPVELIDETVKAALIIISPIDDISKYMSGVYRVFLLGLLACVSMTSILVYFTSKRITKPLQDINDAAKVIANGDFNRRIDIMTDDEIGELARSFNEMAEGLNRLEEYRSNFIANISHDLRSPITSIQGFLNAIIDGTIPCEKQEKYLKIALDETKRLTKLTNDILELTKIENQEIELHRENFDINEMIRNILSTFEARITAKNICTKVIFYKESSWVNADAQKIERVICNLIDNAVKFTDDDRSITISTSETDSKVNIVISDTGIGMSSEEIKHVFERFYKADSSRGKDKKGTGLGLAIVKEIIKAHRENINVKSEVGLGTTFTFSLEKAAEIE